MTFRRRRVAALWIAAVLALGTRAGAAETRGPHTPAAALDASTLAIVTALTRPATAIPLPAAALATTSPAAQASPGQSGSGSGTGRVRRAAVRGALIGAGAAAAVTILAAAAYGRNEGGGICGACALQWGSVAIGAGAGIGAGIGALIGAAAPSRQPGAWPPAVLPGRRRGIALVVRF
jgi:hypothetical protein